VSAQQDSIAGLEFGDVFDDTDALLVELLDDLRIVDERAEGGGEALTGDGVMSHLQRAAHAEAESAFFYDEYIHVGGYLYLSRSRTSSTRPVQS
jgi:hypothetical protein